MAVHPEVFQPQATSEALLKITPILVLNCKITLKNAAYNRVRHSWIWGIGLDFYLIVWCSEMRDAAAFEKCFYFHFMCRKMDGPRTPRDERRRAQHNEGG